jgi:hypothetical protein
MYRTLLSGLSLALGTFASTALGQDARSTPQPPRTAKLGVLVGNPDSPQTAQNLTPASFLTPDQDAVQIPSQMPMPPGGPSAQGATPIPAPRPVQSPSVTEVRNPDGSMAIPVAPQGYPSVPNVPTLVPSTMPDGTYPPIGVEPCLPTDCPTGVPACDRVGSAGRWFSSAEYLMWWTRGMQVPTLLTTSAPGSNGILGQPTTVPVYGGNIGDTYHGGARFSVGRWFCDDPKWGVEGRIFFLGESESSFTANSGEFPVLARPFFNANTPLGQYSELIAYPGLATGSALIKTSTSLWGAEANLRRVLFGNPNGPGFELDAIVGYRFVDLDERLSIEEAFQRTPNSNMTLGTPAISGNVSDKFHTTDMFNGGQIGLAGRYQYGRWSLDGRATIAFGQVEQTADIEGAQTLVFSNGAVSKTAGGLLALPGANIGTYKRYQFAVLPEVSLDLGYQISSHWRVFIGYDFLFLGNALRPGGTIDTTIDASRIPNFPLPGSPPVLPGAPRPGPYFSTSDFFAQGINFGLQFRW